MVHRQFHASVAFDIDADGTASGNGIVAQIRVPLGDRGVLGGVAAAFDVGGAIENQGGGGGRGREVRTLDGIGGLLTPDPQLELPVAANVVHQIDKLGRISRHDGSELWEVEHVQTGGIGNTEIEGPAGAPRGMV